MLVVSNNHIGHLPLTGDEQGHLSLDFKGNGGYLAGQFPGNDVMTGYSSAVNLLEVLYLAGFETACFTMNSIYGVSPNTFCIILEDF